MDSCTCVYRKGRRVCRLCSWKQEQCCPSGHFRKETIENVVNKLEVMCRNKRADEQEGI